MKKLSNFEQITYMLGYEHGAKVGFTKGYEQGIEEGYISGVEDLFSQLKKEASFKLREERNGNPMAFYRYLKSKYE
ncbi:MULTISPECIES: hypothetical protein [Bacillus cereus group]|uniref:hypothetical protein n=1 Tax=Bacillus cereus group TaxID=86661 RepID=UPI000994F29A|nr:MULTISPECIES: hypothetical protein [Bacillus cereus group]MBG9840878.1 hypothetical protein [Bacillus tropicus]MBG9841119.1 hypothetical protein [Bacillus tropicus]MBG9841124.1 hypothetical protein [Bacillus tropicus]MBG9841132.1 hypothetical protein [Bacillus tropicus]MBG9879684.1 hypothetical protein [Bacillus tropicus]